MGGFSTFVTLMLGVKFIFKPVMTTKAEMESVSKKRRIIGSVISGVFIGFICGFVGAGGGMMLLFVLTTFLGYQMHMAVGTSIFIMAFTAFTGGISHFAIGGIPDMTCMGLCVVFTLLWAQIAAKIANKSDAKTLNRVVGVVMIVTSVVILIVD